MNGGDTTSSDSLAAAKDEAYLQRDSVEQLTTRALRFLSTASSETIGGIAVGLAACTYLVLGRVGLVLIGALGGIALHATWEGQNSLTGTDGDARREKGLDIVKRILDFRENHANDLDDDEEPENGTVGTGFDAFQPETAAALNELVEAVIKDYVKWWYHPMLPKEQSFPAASRQTLTKFILSVSCHLSRKRPADVFLDFLTNSSSIAIVFLNELSSALSISQGSTVPAAEAIQKYLAANPESNLANVLSTRQQAKKFKMIAGDILQNFLEKPAYDCIPVRIFLREVLAGMVLEGALKSCSKPEWINKWIIYLLEQGEPDISQAIDAGVGTGNGFADSLDVIDGNVGNIGIAKPSKSQVAKQEDKKHKKRLSKAEEAMEEAMQEARRLSQLIAAEDAKKLQKAERISEEIPKSLVAVSGPNSQSQDPNPTRLTTTSSTSLDQIVAQPDPTASQDEPPITRSKTASLTLHNANILIHDDSMPVDKGKIRSKPTGDYLLQIEPASSQHPGWMTVRRYSDFETLHEVLRRIAQVSGVIAFAEQHQALPSWKDHTKASLRGELERYLRDACWYQPLAESEGMKRFLEKDPGQSSNLNQKSGFSGIGWSPSAFENMGKGVLDALTSAPKGVAEGGKVISGGITGVFTNIGNLGQKKTNGGSNNIEMHSAGRSSTSTLPIIDNATPLSGSRKGRASEDSLRASPIVQTQPSKFPPMERRPSYNSIAEDDRDRDREPRASSERSSIGGRRSGTQSRDPSRAPSRKGTPLPSPVQDEIRLPPPPSDISDDYASQPDVSSPAPSRRDSSTPTTRTSTSTAPFPQSPGRPSLSAPRRPSLQVTQASSRKGRKEWAPLTEQETRVAVELIFAVVNEVYTLSSAWNIRRTLLTAAKTFLLRPGNPSLSSIQSLIQDSVIATNTSDEGVAANLRKLRQNALPTEEERKAWPAEMSMEEKERLRVKARKLLVERGVPAALSGVMGQAATSEAMQRVFDALQVEEVARGLVFGLLLQGVRAVTH
ncbi:hypothetical protein M430DRAFT_62664 [Amorphotheca resinae ATCC 22711]|uniref:PXA domain-containing protein n=1 Tax=Amorphotheca resinae ATCC 22711 TaxID=857342 RepID=A0A2T3BDE8_AMORE|nr:hypothetical protein M430DRAFT_62664 [Amorphotheca resinae ATCC 22711]PSS27416.1 hypothetical protein M430DRAFT_62664 [Amorphotheca resinae ATCC 22711]